MNKIRIKDIFYINQQNVVLSDYKFINYLDTSNITTNQITDIQKLNVKTKEIPSRARRFIKENTIIYSAVRPNLKHYGIIRKPLENMVVSTGFITLDIKDEFSYDVNYLYYNLTQNKYTNYLHTIACNNVSSYPAINPSDIENLEIEIESDVNIQKKIARLLTNIDSKIELNNKINEELEKIAKTLYDYWFVQFDFPNETNRPYKSSGGAMVYNEELKREIPKGWEVKSLYEIAEYTNGLACQNYRPVNGEFYNVIKIKEMHEGFSCDTEHVRIDVPKKHIVENGDILFSWSATLEIQQWIGGKGVLNQHIFKVTSNHYPKSFYYFEIKNYINIFKRIAETRKTTMGHITIEHLKQAKIIIPPSHLIRKLDTKITPVFYLSTKLKEENQSLMRIRDFLLPMLINGQVKVI